MTDKEAIEILKGLKSLRLTATLDDKFICVDIPNNYKEALEHLILSYEVLCNELDKKNKEIEYWKEHWKKAIDESNKCIPKSKIQEKIDELENKINEHQNRENLYAYHVHSYIEEFKRELLKGEDE